MFDTKHPLEEIVVTFDYSAAGEVVTSPVVTVRVLSGIDTNPNAILSGSPVVFEYNKVLQKVTGGINNCRYEFCCLASVNGSRPIIRAALEVSFCSAELE